MFDDVFACSLVSKRLFGITRSCKKFADCMRMSKFVFGFDPDYFDLLSNEIKALGKTAPENFQKDIKKHRFVFGVGNQILKKDVVFQLFLLKSTNHLFFCLKGNRMVGKCKLCSKIFIKDIDHARKIEHYFKVTNKDIEGTLISMLMNEMLF